MHLYPVGDAREDGACGISAGNQVQVTPPLIEAPPVTVCERFGGGLGLVRLAALVVGAANDQHWGLSATQSREIVKAVVPINQLTGGVPLGHLLKEAEGEGSRTIE